MATLADSFLADFESSGDEDEEEEEVIHTTVLHFDFTRFLIVLFCSFWFII